MCNALAVALGGQAAVQAYGEYQSAKADEALAKAQEKVAKARANDALYRGGLDAGDLRMEGSRVEGAQRAATAASNIDSDSASARDLFSSTRIAVEEDVANAKANAAREAWGHKVDAETARYQAKMAKRRSILGPLSAAAGGGATYFAARGK